MIPIYAPALTLSYMKSSGYRHVSLIKINWVRWNLEQNPLNVCFKMSLSHSSDLFISCDDSSKKKKKPNWLNIMLLNLKISLNFFKGDKYTRKTHIGKIILYRTLLNSRKKVIQLLMAVYKIGYISFLCTIRKKDSKQKKKKKKYDCH